MERQVRAAATAAVLGMLATGLLATAPSARAAEASSTPTPSEQVRAYVEPSIVYLTMKFSGKVLIGTSEVEVDNGRPIEVEGACTGYVISTDGYIATAGHCVDPEEAKEQIFLEAARMAIQEFDLGLVTPERLRDSLRFKLDEPGGDPDIDIEVRFSVGTGTVEAGDTAEAEVAESETADDGDAAVVKVDEDGLNALPISTDVIDIGKQIVAIGFAGSVGEVTEQDLVPSYKEGQVSSVRTVSQGEGKVYEISAALSGGMSGGPTVDLGGHVLAFNSFRLIPELETQQFNFVRPVKSIGELLDDAGGSNDLSDETRAYRSGLDAFFAGDRDKSVKLLKQVVEAQPDNELAETYLARAEELPPPKSSLDLGVVLGIVGGAAGGALIVVLAIVLMRRSRHPRPVPAYGGFAPAPPPTYAPPAAQQYRPGPPTQAFPPQAPPTAAPQFPPPTYAPPAPAAPPTAPPPPADPRPARPARAACPGCGQVPTNRAAFCVHCGTTLP